MTYITSAIYFAPVMTKQEAIKAIRDAAFKRLSDSAAHRGEDEVQRSYLIEQASGMADAAQLLEDKWID